MPRANLVILAVFLGVTVPFVCLTLARPVLLAPYARLLPPKTWRIVQLVATLFFQATLIYAFTKGRRTRPTRT